MRSSGNGFKRLLLLLIVVLFGLSASSRYVLAQGTNGTLTGQVVDPSGAAIPEASITLTNVGTSFPQTVTTDGTGIYVFKLVQPGNYMLTVVARGFAKYVQQGIVIDANVNATQNVSMKLGSSSQTVSVTADAELIDTTTAELGMTVNENSVSAAAAERTRSLDAGASVAGRGRCRQGRRQLDAVRVLIPRRDRGLRQWRAHRQHLLHAGWRLQHGQLPGHQLAHAEPRRHAGVPADLEQLQRGLWLLDRRRCFDGHAGAAPTHGMAGSSSSCATAILTQGTGATTHRILSGATSLAAMSADRP